MEAHMKSARAFHVVVATSSDRQYRLAGGIFLFVSIAGLLAPHLIEPQSKAMEGAKTCLWFKANIARDTQRGL
jgi:hypothetical protein